MFCPRASARPHPVVLDLRRRNPYHPSVASLAVARWLVARTARTPLAWVVWALLGGVCPLGMARSTLGIGLSQSPPDTLFYEVAFISAILGGALGLLSLGQARFLLAPLSRSERFLGEGLGLLLVVGMSLMAPLITLPFVAPGLGPIQPTPVVGRLALMAAHVAALSLLISRAPTSTGLHLALLVALSWWIPAALSTVEGSVGAVRDFRPFCG